MKPQNNQFIFLPYLICGAFSPLLLIYALLNRWPSWTVASILFGLVACVGLFRLEGVSRDTRRLVFCIVEWSQVLLWVLNQGNSLMILGMVFAFIILFSLFDRVDMHYVALVAICAIVAAQLFVTLCFGQDLRKAILIVLGSYFPAFLVEGIELNRLKVRLGNIRRLNETVEELRAAEQGKMDFMANVSHEIRTPLNAICGIGTALLSEPLPDSARESVRQLNVAGRQLTALVSDILDFTELENDRVELVQEPYSLTSLLYDALQMVEAWNVEKGLDLIVDCDANIPNTLVGDSQKIYRILLNLLNNAVKFTDEGGVMLTLKSRRESYGVNLAIEIRDTGIGIREQDLEKLNAVYNQVDTRRDRKEGGVGLGLAIARRMIALMNGFMHISSIYGEGTTVSVVIPQRCVSYAPLASLEHSEAYNVLYYVDLGKYKNGHIRDAYVACIEHISQGLQVPSLRCHSILELQRRTKSGQYNYVFTSIVEYRSNRREFDELSGLATVTVIVDRIEEAKQVSPGVRVLEKPFHLFSIASVLSGSESVLTPGESHDKPAAFRAPGARVLAVDDVLMNLNVLTSLLKPYEIIPDLAESGQDALEKLRTQTYDLIFLDHMMPEMDGVETLRRIRKLSGGELRELPVVALTANAVGGARELLLREGFDDFVSKPIERNALERVLRKYLERHIAPARPEPVPQAAPAPADLLAALHAVNGLDVEAGMLYCGGDAESYRDILCDFLRSAPQRQARLEEALQKEDLASYKIDVHSLKGMTATVGAAGLSAQARQLQQFCEDGDAQAVHRDHPTFQHRLEALVQELSARLGVPLQAQAAGPLAQLATAVAAFDQEQALALCDELARTGDAALAGKLRECMEQFDFLEAQRLLNQAGGDVHA